MNIKLYWKALNCAVGHHKYNMISEACKTIGDNVYGGYPCENCGEWSWQYWFTYGGLRQRQKEVAHVRDQIRNLNRGKK